MTDGTWFSIAADRDGEIVEITDREYTDIVDGVATRMDITDHTYETRVDEWGEKYEEVVDSWQSPGIRFQMIGPSAGEHYIAQSSSRDGDVDNLTSIGIIALTGVANLSIRLDGQVNG